MTDPFGATYAGAYDALYEAKDYSGEVKIVEAAVRRAGRPGTREILDLGCGTGRHAVLLAERGYDVVGVDRSPAMLALAEKRAAEAGQSIGLIQGDVRTVNVDRTFDAVLLMFAVLGYQLTDDDVRRTLDTVARHLRPDGLLLFDIWYGPAVEAEGPTERSIVVHDGETTIERHAVGVLDRDRRTCTIRYTLHVSGAGPAAETVEEHTVRYFSGPELKDVLRQAGMDLVSLSAFPEVDRPADLATWNAFVVARAHSDRQAMTAAR